MLRFRWSGVGAFRRQPIGFGASTWWRNLTLGTHVKLSSRLLLWAVERLANVKCKRVQAAMNAKGRKMRGLVLALVLSLASPFVVAAAGRDDGESWPMYGKNLQHTFANPLSN